MKMKLKNVKNAFLNVENAICNMIIAQIVLILEPMLHNVIFVLMEHLMMKKTKVVRNVIINVYLAI